MSPSSPPRAHGPAGTLTPWDRAGFHVAAEQRGVGGTSGGDFFTLAVRSPGHIGVIIGDTCGRGSDGEAQLSRFLPRLHELALSGLGPAALLSELNRVVALELPSDRFVTAAAFEFDMRAGVLTVANAAHVPAMVRRSRGNDVAVIGHPSGMPLGIAANSTYFDEQTELYHGDVIVLMTDGVLEALEADLVAMSTLKRILAESSEAVGADGVHGVLLRLFDDCTVGARPDDMTLMALEAIPEPLAGSFLDFARAS